MSRCIFFPIPIVPFIQQGFPAMDRYRSSSTQNWVCDHARRSRLRCVGDKVTRGRPRDLYPTSSQVRFQISLFCTCILSSTYTFIYNGLADQLYQWCSSARRRLRTSRSSTMTGAGRSLADKTASGPNQASSGQGESETVSWIVDGPFCYYSKG